MHEERIKISEVPVWEENTTTKDSDRIIIFRDCCNDENYKTLINYLEENKWRYIEIKSD